MGTQHSKFNKVKRNDEFFINHIQNNKLNELPLNIDSLDTRRVVFVSLLGLYHTWKNCPSFLLYTAIFVLPLKRNWIYKPTKYIGEMSTNLPMCMKLFLANVSETKEFIQLLQWKESQGLICWALDEYNDCVSHNLDPLVRPFWCELNSKLTKLYDHVTNDTYNSLNLDANWWRNDDKFQSKFDTKAANILSELYFLPMKYKPIKEIIFQSNPSSLRAVQYYEHNEVDTGHALTPSLFSCVTASDDEESGTETNWVICDDYCNDDVVLDHFVEELSL